MERRERRATTRAGETRYEGLLILFADYGLHKVFSQLSLKIDWT